MKKKTSKYHKMIQKLNPKKNADQGMNNNSTPNLNDDPKNNYPSDIQGLFERLGIE